MSKKIYATVRDYDARTGEAALLVENGKVYMIRLSEVESEVPLQTGLRVSATLDAGERSITRIGRG